MIYPGLIVAAARKLFPGLGIEVDQHQASGCWGVHQVRVRLPDDDTVYRLIVAPADAPISIGDAPVDDHFSERIA